MFCRCFCDGDGGDGHGHGDGGDDDGDGGDDDGDGGDDDGGGGDGGGDGDGGDNDDGGGDDDDGGDGGGYQVVFTSHVGRPKHKRAMIGGALDGDVFLGKKVRCCCCRRCLCYCVVAVARDLLCIMYDRERGWKDRRGTKGRDGGGGGVLDIYAWP